MPCSTPLVPGKSVVESPPQAAIPTDSTAMAVASAMGRFIPTICPNWGDELIKKPTALTASRCSQGSWVCGAFWAVPEITPAA